MLDALDIEVHGVVQGVGFRPFVYKAARRNLISGWVLNATSGVFIHAEGESDHVNSFVMELSENAPAAANVKEILLKEVPLEGFTTFEIRFSEEEDVPETTLVSPDLATCDDCVAELFDPANRRYHYPFINCTNCGPRFTIINGLPYDRAATSMAGFPMCPDCAREYADPEDRRFHAQPDACFDCGPHIYWRASGFDEREWGLDLASSDAIIERAAQWLRQGRILAIKGLGGFHLACDAANPEALAELRRRKRREGKAFAVMVPNLDAVRAVCHVSKAEEDLLTGSVRPIVLLKKRAEATFAPRLCDKLPELGVMLPYTPLQHLLLAAFGGMLVMTSGNLHDEPIQTDDEEAFAKLGGIADAFIGNDRPIVTRFDDSVVRVIQVGTAGDALQMVRRARGYAPMPVPLKRHAAEGQKLDTVFAAGPEQKNTFCLLRGEDAFVSQHIGDMENAETFDAWLDVKARFERLFQATPDRIAYDLHPEYLASKWALEQAAAGAAAEPVQHHHAHIVSVMAENDLTDAVIGVAFDGTGYGVDGRIWGGEVMMANRQDFERFANFAYVPMPGGAAAVKHPDRMAYGFLWTYDLLEHPAAQPMLEAMGQQAELCGTMIDRGLNTPMTSSVGRMFDALSAICSVCTEPLYEGEAAILFEAAMNGVQTDEAYAIDVVKNTAGEGSTAHNTSVVLFDAERLFRGVLDDLAAGVGVETISAKAHNALVAAVLQICLVANAAYGISTVALAGGVFMNRYLIEHTTAALESAGFTIAINRELPPNDGGIAYGQAAAAAARQ